MPNHRSSKSALRDLPANLVVVLLLVACIGLQEGVRASLVAYFPFDADPGQDKGYTGNCANPLLTAAALNSVSFITTKCRFNSCMSVTKQGGYFNAGRLQMFPNGVTTRFSASAWVSTPPTGPLVGAIIHKTNLITFKHNISTSSGEGYLSCTLTFATGSSRTAKIAGNPLSLNQTYSLACTYNGSRVCIYINGESPVCSTPTESSFSESPTNLYIGGDTSKRWDGTIDEVKFYDHVLKLDEIKALHDAVAPNDRPSVSITIDGTDYESGSYYTTQVFSNRSLVANVTDLLQPYTGRPQPSNYLSRLTYSWLPLSESCGAVEMTSSAIRNTYIKFLGLSSSTLTLCVSDGEIANRAVVNLGATDSIPRLVRQPTTSIISVPALAVDYPIIVEGESLPPPLYQWERLVTRLINVTNDTIVERDLVIMDEREIIEVQEWDPIPGATSATLYLNGTMDLDGAIIRCVIYNGGGRVPTSNFTINIDSSPVPSTTPSGGGSDNTGLIAGLVAGVGGGLLLLCILLVLIGLLVALRYRRHRSAYRKLEQPDWEEVIFGDVKDDIAIPKKQAEEYNGLERLLGAPDHQLALAITMTANVSERDQVYRSLLRVLAGQHQAYNFIVKMISREVDDAHDEGTLFRANSAAAKLFTFYMRLVALKYLWQVLVLSVHALNDNARDRTEPYSDRNSSARMFGKGYRMEIQDEEDEESSSGGVAMDILGVSSMELDPQKLDDASDLEINTLELWLIAQKMFKLIIDSEKAVPHELRMLIRRIHDCVSVKFSEEAVFRAMGGFYFLRLICPALLAPQLHGLLDGPPHPMTQRQLILVTKVLQNLANNTLPGAKEAYMERLNSFITSNKPALDRFYDQIINQPNQGRQSDVQIPQRVRNDSLVKVRKFIEANWSTIEATLRAEEDSSNDVDELIGEVRQALNMDS